MKAILRAQAINVAVLVALYLIVGQTALYVALGWYGAIAVYLLLALVSRALAREVEQTGADMVDLWNLR